MHEAEQLVFVDESGKPTGETGPKLASHTAHTRLHLAFSCYIFRRTDGRFLLTQRAFSKKVWPGMWTNSVCGHPAPGELMDEAIRRRAKAELGIAHLDDIQVVLPRYRYTTPEYHGIVENEFCPVYIASTDSEVHPNPAEVEAYRWLTWKEYVVLITDTTKAHQLSYWAKDQYRQLQHKKPFKSA